MPQVETADEIGIFTQGGCRGRTEGMPEPVGSHGQEWGVPGVCNAEEPGHPERYQAGGNPAGMAELRPNQHNRQGGQDQEGESRVGDVNCPVGRKLPVTKSLH